MSLRDLPREAIDHIIQLLAEDDDDRTLNACSLVGWVFLPSCRYAKFPTINIEYGELGAFLGVIDYPLSTITPALRKIRFKQKPGYLRHLLVDGGDNSHQGTIPVVSQETITTLQHQIRSIQLEGIPPRGIVGFWNFMADLKGVKEVEMESGVFEMMEMVISDLVVDWLCGLPELEELSVVKSSSLSVSSSSASSASASSLSAASWAKAAESLEWQMPVILPSWTAVMESERVKARNAGGMRVSLDIGDWDQLGVVRWLMVQSPVPCVRTLRIGSSRKGFWDGGSACDVHLLKTFIEKVGSDIENLEILLPGDDETNVLESLDLSTCINLRRLQISGFQIGPSDRTQRTALEILLERLLHCADGPYLREITLMIEVDPHVRHMLAFFSIPDIVIFGKFDWGRIPELLARGLQRSSGAAQKLALVVQRCSKCHHEEIEQVLRRRIFRELEELSVRFDDDGGPS